ncbi:MAG: hypothetical protein ACO3O2_01650 [Candidatus Nanopelagicales bacterium]
MGSSIILIAMVALWAAVLIPLMFKRNSQQFESKSVDRFKNAMSLISRTSPSTKQGKASLQVQAARARRKRVTLLLTFTNIFFGLMVFIANLNYLYFLISFALLLTWLALAFNAAQKIETGNKLTKVIPEPPRNFKVLSNLPVANYEYIDDTRREIILDERPRPNMRKPVEEMPKERREAQGA